MLVRKISLLAIRILVHGKCSLSILMGDGIREG